MSYESPIQLMVQQIEMQKDEQMMKAIQKVGINVDKEELAKALTYDRNQYDKGYKQGWNNAIDEFVKFANTLPTVGDDDKEIRPMWLEEMAEHLKVK